jgi:ornithine cyclodeaminase
MTVAPLIRGDWIRPGSHVDLVGSYKPDMREADDALLERARIFVDSRDTTMTKSGELAIPLATGTISADDVLGDHYQLASGQVAGRTSSDDITVFKNGGGGHLDLMTARFVVDRIR